MTSVVNRSSIAVCHRRRPGVGRRHLSAAGAARAAHVVVADLKLEQAEQTALAVAQETDGARWRCRSM